MIPSGTVEFNYGGEGTMIFEKCAGWFCTDVKETSPSQDYCDRAGPVMINL
jgi:hypothetical protein